MPPNSYSES